jgi:hypothetical protein
MSGLNIFPSRAGAAKAMGLVPNMASRAEFFRFGTDDKNPIVPLFV